MALHPSIPYELAKKAVLGFGKYKGQTLEQISTGPHGEPDFEGLKYLDWLVGEYRWFKEKCPELFAHVAAFLADPAVAADLDEALGR